AAVFWNPLIRKITGLGYIDLVLVHSRFARRRLFAPFADSFLGDIRGWNEIRLDRIAYFTSSRVWHHREITGRRGSGTGLDEPIVTALAALRGRILLLGKSGLGKSSFLRYSLARRATEAREVIVYLRADQCRRGVEAEIEQRMQGFGRDQNLLQSMIYAG